MRIQSDVLHCDDPLRPLCAPHPETCIHTAGESLRRLYCRPSLSSGPGLSCGEAVLAKSENTFGSSISLLLCIPLRGGSGQLPSDVDLCTANLWRGGWSTCSNWSPTHSPPSSPPPAPVFYVPPTTARHATVPCPDAPLWGGFLRRIWGQVAGSSGRCEYRV